MVDISRTILDSWYTTNTFLTVNNPRRFVNPELVIGPVRSKKPYFFIPIDGRIRHCRVYNDVFLDYTVRPLKAFPTLEEWVADVGSTIEDVRFGYEAQDPAYLSVTVAQLIEPMEKKFKPEPVDEFRQLEYRMTQLGLGFANVAVVNNDRVTMARDFMADA